MQTGEKPYQCSECDNPFYCKHNPLVHRYTYTGEKPYHCKQYNNIFFQKVIILSHQKIHTGEKPYIDKKFIMHFILTTDTLLGLKNHFKKLLFFEIFLLNAS